MKNGNTQRHKLMKRILLKLSGEALSLQGQIINSQRLSSYAVDIAQAHAKGTQIAIVIGAGNIYRGSFGLVSRLSGDYMGMLATMINSMALAEALRSCGVQCELFSALEVEPLAQKPSEQRVEKALQEGNIVFFAGGTGNPYFTTDTAGVLRALEIGADCLLKGTRVAGIYTADPEKDSTATKFTHLTYGECMTEHLNVMDQTAFALAAENLLPICVFDMNTKGNLVRLVQGEQIGTMVTSE